MRKVVLGALLFVVFVPVMLVTECVHERSSFEMVGYCSYAGRSLIGDPIPGALLGGATAILVILVLLAPFLYLGYRMDSRARKDV